MIINKTTIIVLLLSIVVLLGILFVLRKKTEGFQSNPTKYAEPTEMLLINMDSRQDRLVSFRDSYNASDCKERIPLKRISAIVGKGVDWKNGLLTPQATKNLEETILTGKRKEHEWLTVGAIGCYLSHLKAMEYVVEKGTPMIVCEDDAILPIDFYKRMKAGLLLLPPEQNVMLLFHVICGGWEKLKCILKSDNFYEIQQFWSTACYYITPETAKTILANAKPLEMQIDSMMSRMVQQNKLRIYANPIVKTNLNLGTDIQTPLQ